MAETVTVHVENLAEFRRDLRRTDREALKEVQSGIKSGAQEVAKAAGENAPRGTRPIPATRKPAIRLADSYKATTSGNKGVVYDQLPQSPVWEYGGTVRPAGFPIRIPARAPVGKAIEAKQEEIVNNIGDGIERAARRTGWNR